jgi:hypothetical protein
VHARHCVPPRVSVRVQLRKSKNSQIEILRFSDSQIEIPKIASKTFRIDSRHTPPPNVQLKYLSFARSAACCKLILIKLRQILKSKFSDSQIEIPKIASKTFRIDSRHTTQLNVQFKYLSFARSAACCKCISIKLRSMLCAKFWNPNRKILKSKFENTTIGISSSSTTVAHDPCTPSRVVRSRAT